MSVVKYLCQKRESSQESNGCLSRFPDTVEAELYPKVNEGDNYVFFKNIFIEVTNHILQVFSFLYQFRSIFIFILLFFVVSIIYLLLLLLLFNVYTFRSIA